MGWRDEQPDVDEMEDCSIEQEQNVRKNDRIAERGAKKENIVSLRTTSISDMYQQKHRSEWKQLKVTKAENFGAQLNNLYLDN